MPLTSLRESNDGPSRPDGWPAYSLVGQRKDKGHHFLPIGTQFVQRGGLGVGPRQAGHDTDV